MGQCCGLLYVVVHHDKAKYPQRWLTVESAVDISWSFFLVYLTKTPQSSPVKAMYGASLVNANLADVLAVSLFCCVQDLVIYDRDISGRVDSNISLLHACNIQSSYRVKCLLILCFREIRMRTKYHSTTLPGYCYKFGAIKSSVVEASLNPHAS